MRKIITINNLDDPSRNSNEKRVSKMESDGVIDDNDVGAIFTLSIRSEFEFK